MSIWVRLGGSTPATELAAHSAPTWETLADGGSGEASFELAVSPKTSSQLLRPKVRMEILCGSYRVWLGRIADFDRQTGTVVGRGIHTDAYGIPALSGGATTRDIGPALATASASPWNWFMNNMNGVSGVALGDDTSPLMVGDLLDLVAEQTGKRWGQDPNTNLYMRSDPTTPTWLTTPESSVFGSTDEGRPTHLVGRYDNGTTNATTVRGSGSVPTAELVDLTERGTLTEAQANSILDAALAAAGPRYGWVNGATLHQEQITTIGGTPAALETVRAGRMVRPMGVSYAGAGSMTPDMVIGKTRFTAGSASIYIEPVNTAPRTFADVIAAASSAPRRRAA